MKLTADGSLELSEAAVTHQVIDYLHAQGWYCIRMQSGLLQRPGSQSRIRLTEPGAPDWCCLKADYDGGVECLFLEIKRKRGKVSEVQAAWHAGMIKKGFRVMVVSDASEFIAWYRQSFYGDAETI